MEDLIENFYFVNIMKQKTVGTGETFEKAARNKYDDNYKAATVDHELHKHFFIL